MNMALKRVSEKVRGEGAAVSWRKSTQRFQDKSILLYQVVPSASKIEAEIFREFELYLDHPGGNEEGIQDENHQESESRPSGGKC